jgi:hypothetical protein
MNQMKKSIIFSSYDDRRNPWYAGGGALAIHEVAKSLVQEYDIRVITGMYPGAKQEETIDGVVYQRIGLAFLGPQLGQLAYSLALLWQACSLHYDLWFDSFTPPFGVSLIPKSNSFNSEHFKIFRAFIIIFFVFQMLRTI